MFVLSKISRHLITRQLPTITQCPVVLKITNPDNIYNANYSVFNKNDNRLRDQSLLSVNLADTCLGKRFKSKKKQKKQDDDEGSDDEIEKPDLSEWKKDDPSLDKDSKIETLNVASMRADTVIKSTLRIPRNKVDVCFYEGKIRRNGLKIQKKSSNVDIGDEIDVIKGFNTANPKNLNIARIIILEAMGKKDAVSITFRVFKSLVIENYDEAPFELGDIDE